MEKIIDNTKNPCDKKEVEPKVLGICDYCQDEITDDEDSEEGHEMGQVDDSITLCDSCYQNCVE